MRAALHSVESDSTSSTVQPCTAAQLASAAGVSRRMIFLALKVRRDGCPELQGMTVAGIVTMNLAAAVVDMFPDHDDQRAVIAEFPELPSRERLRFARRVAALVTPASTATEPSANPARTHSEPAGSTAPV